MQERNEYSFNTPHIEMSSEAQEGISALSRSDKSSNDVQSFLNLQMQKYDLSLSSADVESQRNSLYNEIINEVETGLKEVGHMLEGKFIQPCDDLNDCRNQSKPSSPDCKLEKKAETSQIKISPRKRSCSNDRLQKTEKKMRKSYIIKKKGQSIVFHGSDKRATVCQQPSQIELAQKYSSLSMKASQKFSSKPQYKINANYVSIVSKVDIFENIQINDGLKVKDYRDSEDKVFSQKETDVPNEVNFVKIQNDKVSMYKIDVNEKESNYSRNFKIEYSLDFIKNKVSADDDSSERSFDNHFDAKAEFEATEMRIKNLKLQKEIDQENALMRNEVY
jgi:hypothetical protein